VTDGIGEWAADDPGQSADSAIAAVIASVDLDASVKDAVHAVMRKRVEAIAAEAVDAVLDEPAREQLRTAADNAARAALTAPAASVAEEAAPELYYPDIVAFVTEQLVPMYRRPLGGQGVTWCPEWWRHADEPSRV